MSGQSQKPFISPQWAAWKASECMPQTNAITFFFYLLKTIKNLFFRITLCEIKQPDNEIEIRENGMMGIILKILNSVKM